MAVKDVLVVFDDASRAEARMRAAVAIAERNGAHVTGLYVIPPISLFTGGLPFTGSTAEIEALEHIQASSREVAFAAASRAETALRESAQRADLSVEWRVVEGDIAATATLHARYADLVVLGQNDPDHPTPGGQYLVESVLLGSGRPLLVIPYVGRFDRIGRHAVVCWNATREAARALNDALPLLQAAERVTVLSVNPQDRIGDEKAWPGADIAHHLARHGVNTEASYTVSPDIDIGNTILSRAADLDADLIVMGGYGHSRQREFILGGATRTILQHMTMPVFLAH